MSEPVVDNDPHFKELMRKLAKKLNLAKHTVKFVDSQHNTVSKTRLSTCVDMEGHHSLVSYLTNIIFLKHLFLFLSNKLFTCFIFFFFNISYLYTFFCQFECFDRIQQFHFFCLFQEDKRYYVRDVSRLFPPEYVENAELQPYREA
jgi:hypothetical protein